MKRRKTVAQGIIEGLREAVAFERGELPDTDARKVLTARFAYVEEVPVYDSERIMKVREGMELSQPVFASVLNVSVETVRSWEQGKRAPDGAAVRLLQVAEEHPKWLRAKARPSAMKSTRVRQSLE